MASLDRATESSDYLPSLYRPTLTLPITAHARALQYTITTTPITILIGETGSGKTTQLPQFLSAAGFNNNSKLIACTQPRRVAATTVATRVAEEMGVKLGEEVGYSIRFEDVTSPRTKIKYMTDGMLLREVMVDPLLTRYSVVMVDEAHERSLSTDILLGVLKKIRRKRKDLRVVVASATLQAEAYRDFFTKSEDDVKEVREREEKGEGPLVRVVSVEGRCWPVDVLYTEQPVEDYVENALQTVMDIHLKEGDGDILVFFTGRDEIERAVTAIAERSSTLHPRAPQLLPLPLYAGLSSEQQLAVFDSPPENHRKVIFSTNIAEASVTIDGIAFVIDCGFVKLRCWNPLTAIESLTAVPISQASATQRAGRAGRTKAGKCFRLYTEQAYQALDLQSVPEIQRSCLAPVVLQLKSLGIDNVARFDYVSAPPAELMIRSLELLYALGALDEYAKLTRPLGIRMAELPVDPMLAKMLLNSVAMECFAQILSVAAMTTITPPFLPHCTTKHRFTATEGDHLTLLNIYTAFTTVGKKSSTWCHNNQLNFKALQRAVSVRGQLWRYLERFYPDLEKRECKGADGEVVRRCVASGLFAHAARMQPDGTFRLVGGGEEVLWAHPSSVLFSRKAEWCVFGELVEMRGKKYIRDITVIEKGWLTEVAPEYYQVKQQREQLL